MGPFQLNQIITSKHALKLLRGTGCSSAVIQHCKAVSNLAVKIARKIKKKRANVDVKLVKIGGLLHDIGRAETHDINHGVIGANIARSFNLPIPIVRIVERHVLAGILAHEAVKLGLPNRDFIPETLEEKIVSYADKLIDGAREISFNDALIKFSNEFGRSHLMINRFMRLHTELEE